MKTPKAIRKAVQIREFVPQGVGEHHHYTVWLVVGTRTTHQEFQIGPICTYTREQAMYMRRMLIAALTTLMAQGGEA